MASRAISSMTRTSIRLNQSQSPSLSTRASMTTFQLRFASDAKKSGAQNRPNVSSGDYGSGTGSPEGEKPMEQGHSKVNSDLEHPGPPPPSAGHGSGGATKADGSGHVDGRKSS